MTDKKLLEAVSRLQQLYAEAVQCKLSGTVKVEVSFSVGVPQKVQDERKRYELVGA